MALFALCVLPVFARAQRWPEDSDPSQSSNNARLRIEAFSYGLSVLHGASHWEGEQSGLASWTGSRILGVQYEWNRWRFGTAIEETPVGWSIESYLPIKLGNTIWNRPVGVAWRIQVMVPEVSAELTACWWNSGFSEWDLVPLAARADLVAGVDMLGLGLSLSAGVIYIMTKDGHDTNYGWQTFQGVSPNFEIRLRAGTVAFDLTPD